MKAQEAKPGVLTCVNWELNPKQKKNHRKKIYIYHFRLICHLSLFCSSFYRITDDSCLPNLKLSDLPPTLTTYHVQREMLRVPSAQVPVFKSLQPTNGVTYVRALYRVSPSHNLLPFLPLYSLVSFACCFTRCIFFGMLMFLAHVSKALTNMGTGKRDKRQYAQDVEQNTGGLHVSADVDADPFGLRCWYINFGKMLINADIGACFFFLQTKI